MTQWALLIALLIVAMRADAAEPKFPPLTGRVVDDANILNPSTTMELRGMLADHERATGEQVVVVTLDSLNGYSIETYGYQLGRIGASVRKARTTARYLSWRPRSAKSASRLATASKERSPTRSAA